MDEGGLTQVHDEAGERLRAALQALKPPKVPIRSAAPVSSVYGRAAAAVPADAHPATSRAAVGTRFTATVATALLPGTTLALVVTPDPAASAEVAVHCRRLVESGAVVLHLAPHLTRQVADRSQVITVPLREDDSLSQEWALLACGPARRVALLAQQESGGSGSWRWLTTRDSVAVHRAGTAILERVPFLGLFVPALSA